MAQPRAESLSKTLAAEADEEEEEEELWWFASVCGTGMEHKRTRHVSYNGCAESDECVFVLDLQETCVDIMYGVAFLMK